MFFFVVLGQIIVCAEALKWERGEDFRRAPLTVAPAGRVGFTLLSQKDTGVVFTNTLALQRILANINLINGSGVALGDYDGDGLCDLYFCNLNGTNALFKNLGGFKFKETTVEAGVTCFGQTCTGAVFADVNGDGWLDLLVTSMGGPNACFINQGNGKFANVTEKSGIVSKLGAMSMALADIDGDGTLDLYIANYGATSILRSGGTLNLSYVNGQPVVRGRYAQRIKLIGNTMFELGEPDGLYLNDGKGNFKAVSWTDGRFLDEEGKSLKEAPWDQGLSVVFRDINGDGAPDIYVCNDSFTPDRCWINDGKGHFKALSRLAWRTTSHFSMGVDFGDLNRDGYDDFFVVDMLSRHHSYAVTQKGLMSPQPRIPGDLQTQLQMRRNTLYQNRGDDTFAEIAYFGGVAGSEWSWCGLFMDVDLDGWEDILVANGFLYNADDLDTKEKVKAMGPLGVEQSRRTWTMYPPLKTPNVAFRNDHNMTFTEMGKAWGFDSSEVSNGMAFADLDNDGDLDVVINCFGGPALIYRNDTDAPRIGIRLKGKSPNTQGIGAKIKVYGGPVTQTQEVMSGGRYVSGDDPMRVFACGSAAKLRIEVVWRSGGVSVVENALPNSIYELDETGASRAESKPAPGPAPLFRDVSDLLNHKHAETFFDDLQTQSSLPNLLSQMGPGLSWCDIDGDGRDDLIIGAGRGSEPAVLRNTESGFQKITPFAFGKEETGAALGYKAASGEFTLLVGIDNYEARSGKDLMQYRSADKTQASGEALSGNDVIGPLAVTELDKKMFLFAGGRFIPGRYPEAASSFIYRLENGRWLRDEPLSQAFAAVGLVTGAVWSDLDQDGTAELIVSCEWGTIRVFQYHGGKFIDATERWGLNALVGRWQSVAVADLDGDGRMDLIAGNWGLNSFYNQAADHQVELIYGDINGTGAVEMIEAYFDVELKKTVPWRDMIVLSQSFPWLAEKFHSHKEFAAASVEEILTGRMQRVNRIKTTTLANMVFLNRGGKFEAHELSPEAQYAPVFGITAADFDGDGHQDLFLAQNFFAVREDDSRLDGGRGLLLRGKGRGELEAVSGQVSGLKIYGEQRGCAASDYDGDGRIDLAVAQNANSTKLFKNERGLPGLRVRVRGNGENLSGAGVQMKIGSGQNWGPVVELHAGSGHWSQDSAIQVLARKPEEQKLAVLWPGGKHFETDVPPNALEIEIREDGTVTAVR